MATIAFPQHSKIVTLPSGTTYSYLHIAAHPNNPTVLFLHGFPSSSYDWRFQISQFSSQGYGVLAPDLLGYGATDRPISPSAYTGKKMASEITEILDHEKLEKVHGVAHDWGCFLLGRLANWFPERLVSASFLAIPYRPPGIRFDLEERNRAAKEAVGYEVFGYWKFFEREDAGEILRDHFDSFWSMIYCADPELWKEHVAPVGALEPWMKSDKLVETGKWVTAEDKAMHDQIMQRNYNPALNWYRAGIHNLNLADETGDPRSPDGKLDPVLHMPSLLIVAERDPLAKGADKMMAPVAENLRIERLGAGHWVQLEMPGEVNWVLESFVAGVEAAGRN